MDHHRRDHRLGDDLLAELAVRVDDQLDLVSCAEIRAQIAVHAFQVIGAEPVGDGFSRGANPQLHVLEDLSFDQYLILELLADEGKYANSFIYIRI